MQKIGWILICLFKKKGKGLGIVLETLGRIPSLLTKLLYVFNCYDDYGGFVLENILIIKTTKYKAFMLYARFDVRCLLCSGLY